MSKFNSRTAYPVGRGPVVTESHASGTTFEGGPGFARDEKSELFLLAVSNMVGENTFYEGASVRDSRFSTLVRTVAVADPDWMIRFAGWLRSSANMRSAPLVLAAEATKALLDAGQPGSRKLIDSVLQRADEPGEFLAYWRTHFGAKLPMPVKRGVADAVSRLYTERNILKYNTAGKAVRFGTVVHATHPKLTPVLRYLLSLSKVSEVEIPDGLGLLRANAEFVKSTPAQIKGWSKDGSLADRLRAAGMTWEAVPSLVDGPWTKELWEAMIPSLGFMAALRNLRNFDQAGVSDVIAATVAARLSDPDEVAKSRQLPMRFLSAYRAAPSLRWAYPLEKALDLSLSNIPELAGRTLILIDTSGSMNSGFSKDGTLMRWDAAVVFGLALARRCAHADVVSFSNQAVRFQLERSESLLKATERWKNGGYFLNGGTATAAATQAAFAKHDRVVILTDEQAGYGFTYGGDPGSVLPQSVPLYTFNLAGYKHGHAAGGPQRHTFGGLTDQGFALIGLLERGRDANWPWMEESNR